MFHAYNRAAFPSARFSSQNAFSAIETFNIYAVNRSQVSIARYSIASHGRSYLKKEFKVISIRGGYVGQSLRPPPTSAHTRTCPPHA